MKKIILIFSILFSSILFSQDLNLKGTVLEKDTNIVLPGATVQIVGKDTGVVTDFDGNFEIIVSIGDKIKISYIGKKTIELSALSSPISVYLESQDNELDEVTVSVGYFDISKKDLSGSIAQISSDQLEKNRSGSVESILQGQVSGLVVSESSEPGGGSGVSIRGTNSILGGTQPLYVLDGIPVDPLSDAQGMGGSGGQQSSLNFINPNDIDKIEVLKDAAATAIYGARGANGVILITTKTANNENGKDKISLTYESYVTSVRKNIDVLDGPGFESYMNQRVLNQIFQEITDPNRNGDVFDGSQQINTTNFPEIIEYGSIPYPQSQGINTNWQDETYRLSLSNKYNINYRGGDFKRNITMGLGVNNQEGVIINSNNKTINFNMNAKRKAFNDKIDIYSKSYFTHKTGNAASVGNGEIFQQRGVVSQALQFQPIFSLLEPGQDDDIYSILNEGNIVSNPYSLARYVIDSKKSFSFRQTLQIVGRITPKLTATLKGSYNFQKSNRDNYYPLNTTRGRNTNGQASQASLENSKTYAEINFRYRNKFKNHRLDATLVGTYENNEIRSILNKARGFGSDATSFYNFASAEEILTPITQFREVGMLSALFRVGYNYKRKYFIDLNTRVDASSKFSTNNKSALFPSVAFSWFASKEDFFKKYDNLNELKFRMSYGKIGSNPISPYQSLALMTPIRYNFNDEIITGFFESNLANDDLTWETTDQFNFGIDIGLLDSKLNFTVDLYHKLTSDLLQNVQLPVSNGYTSRVDNFGEVENKGIDLNINSIILEKEDFSWDINANIGINKNKLIKLNSNLDFQLGPSIGFSQAYPILFMVGQPLGIYWGAQTDGIYANWEEANNSGIAGAAPGEIKYVNNYVDLDESGQPLAIQEINFDDYVKIGDPNPDFTYSISNNFSYKNWDASFLFTGQKGGDLFWVDSWQLTGLQKSTNVLTSSFQNSWIAPITYENGNFSYDPSIGNLNNASHPGAMIDNGKRAISSDRNVYDGSFLRLKNINIGYNFNFSEGRNMRLFISGQNLIVWTDYPGYDPEVRTYTKNPQKRGVDFGTYPGTKSLLIGLKFNY
jgi:TonB-linked SusC/RagA family outer membrane protein